MAIRLDIKSHPVSLIVTLPLISMNALNSNLYHFIDEIPIWESSWRPTKTFWNSHRHASTAEMNLISFWCICSDLFDVFRRPWISGCFSCTGFDLFDCCCCWKSQSIFAAKSNVATLIHPGRLVGPALTRMCKWIRRSCAFDGCRQPTNEEENQGWSMAPSETRQQLAYLEHVTFIVLVIQMLLIQRYLRFEILQERTQILDCRCIRRSTLFTHHVISFHFTNGVELSKMKYV